MKKLVLLIVLGTFLSISAQEIGNRIVEKPNRNFPNNSLGVNLIIGEGGFGLGGFYNYTFVKNLTGFMDFSITESKNTRELQRYDYWGRPLKILGKVNRIFPIPFNFGMQYRLFSESLTDNLRPYISVAVGPTMFITTPASVEFFSAFGDARLYWGVGGYVSFGANFGLAPNNLTGINIRYYYQKLFNDGIENYQKFENNFQTLALTINIGIMY